MSQDSSGLQTQAADSSVTGLQHTGHTLAVEDLHTFFYTKVGVVKAVNGVSFSVSKGEVLGLVGESGSGKSVTGFSILGLVDPPGEVAGGSIRFRGRELVGLGENAMREIRGSRIAMIFQEPMTSFTSRAIRIGDTQIMEAIQLHHESSIKASARKLMQS